MSDGLDYSYDDLTEKVQHRDYIHELRRGGLGSKDDGSTNG